MPYGTKPSFKMKDKTGLYMLDKGKNSALPKYKDTPMDMGHPMKMYGKPMKMAHGDKPMKMAHGDKPMTMKHGNVPTKMYGKNKQSWDIKQEDQ